MKRTLSVILTLAMLISLFTVFFVTEASAATVINNVSPAIPTNVGQTISLSDYSVVFDGDSSASTGLTWTLNGTKITSYTPTEKGVTTLVASNGSKTKNIYVVAKNSSESEYVLYEADLADFASISELTAAGWTMPSSSTPTSLSNGALTVNGSSVTGTAYLPAWLGDFGDYNYSADVKLNSANEGTRWFSLVYRSDNRTGAANFFQMCVRDNNTASNGIEFAENNGSWNVISAVSGPNSTMTDAYRTVNINVCGGDLSYYVGSTQVLYLSSSSYTTKSGITKGHLGLTASGVSLSVKKVKVVLSSSVPEQLPSGLNLIYNNYHDATNLVSPIANVQKVSSATVANLSQLSVAYIDLTGGADATAALSACVSANVVPTFYITTNAQADKVASAISSVGKYDVNVISNTASVLSYMRGKNNKVRTGLSYNMSSVMADGTLTSAEADTVRRAVRSAPATFMVIDSKYATQQAVNELRELAVAVWVNVTSTPNTDAFRLETLTALTAGAHGIISSSASAVSNVIANDFVANTVTRPSYGIGHAGNYDVAEENTMESFIAAYNNGCAILELDTGITSDGIPVLLHDNTLNRTTTYTGSKYIWEMTWAEVQQYNVVNTRTGVNTGKPIPSFEELLSWAQDKDIRFFVEFKWDAHNMIPNAMALIKKYNMLDRCDFISFYSNCNNAVLTNTSGMSTSHIFNNNTTDIKGTNATYAQSLLSLDYWITTAQSSKSTLSPPRYTTITRDVMQAATDRGMTVWPWTYDTYSTNTAFFANVDGMTMINAQDLKDMVNTVSCDSLEMFPGQTYGGGSLVATTYSRYTFNVSADDTVATVISGDSVKVENGKLVAVQEGESTVILGCKAKTYLGQEYVVYTQPLTVTVGGNSASVLRPLITMAETATINSLPAEDLQLLREYHAKAVALVNSAEPSESEVEATAIVLNDLINKFVKRSYTSTAPSYSNDVYTDDGIRLMDGKRQGTTGSTNKYAAWQKTSTTPNVEIVIDYTGQAYNDTFNAYFAANSSWGVTLPESIAVSTSDDGTTWKTATGTLTKTQTQAPTTDNNWELSTYCFELDNAVKARYFKVTINFGTGNFIWVDEIEARYNASPYVAISGINQKITAGTTSIFTPDFGTVSNDTANITWTSYAIAKKNADGDYVVTKVSSSNYAAETFDLASDEILIAAHNWETSIYADSTVVEGSAINFNNVANAKVGQIALIEGINTNDWSLGVAPSVRFVDPHEHVYDSEWVYDDDYHWKECDCGDSNTPVAHVFGDWITDGEYHWKECECGAISEKSAHDDSDWLHDDEGHWKECSCGYTTECLSHVEGEWTPDESGSFEFLFCTDCGRELDTRAVSFGTIGDVDGNEVIDSADYLLIKRYCFNTLSLTDDQKKRADIDGNGDIVAVDYLLLKRICFNTYEIA